MASIAPGVSLSWGHGSPGPNSAALPEAVTRLSPFWVLAGQNQVRLGWPEGRSAPTIYRGLIVYAEGAEPSGAPSEAGEGRSTSQRVGDGLWTFESQGDQ